MSGKFPTNKDFEKHERTLSPGTLKGDVLSRKMNIAPITKDISDP